MEQQKEMTIIPTEREDVQEIDLLELIGYYMTKLPILICGLLIGGILAGAFTYFLIPNTYVAVSRMYMISASSDSVVNLSDLNLGSSLSNDYVELMMSRPVIEDVIDKLGLDYDYNTLCGMINLSVVSNTRIVKISVTSTDPQEAMDIANQMAQTSRTQLPLVMDAPSPSIAEFAVFPRYRSGPSMRKNVMVGAMLGLICLLGIFTVLFLLDDTIKSSDDVERILGVMPLAVIPEGKIGMDTGKTKKMKRRRSKRKKKR